MKKCFMPQFNVKMANLTGLRQSLLAERLKDQIEAISIRGELEKKFWHEEIRKIRRYTREEAIQELIKEKKILKKIAQIDVYIKGLQL